MNNESLSIIVPVYKSEKTLIELNSRLFQVLALNSNDFEIIYVDDGSSDGSWDIIHELSKNEAKVRGIQHGKNYGQHNALLTGIRLARYSIIVTLDDDLQNPPEEIPKLLSVLREGYDVVYGTPQFEMHGYFRKCASKIMKIILKNAMGAHTACKVSSFRAFRKSIRSAFDNYQNPYVCIDVLLTYGTNRFSSIQVAHCERKYGASNYSLVKLITHALNMLTGFSVLPLKMASILGFIFTLFGFYLLLYIVFCYFLYENTVVGFRFLTSIISLFAGAQMFTLGILGEYFSRMHLRSMGLPISVIRHDTHMENQNESGCR